MQAFMKRNRLWAPGVLFLLAMGVALYAFLSLEAIPGHFQYLWPAPAPTAASAGSSNTASAANSASAEKVNAGLKEARANMESLTETLAGACTPVTLYAVADGVSVIASMDNATAATARLEALNDNAYIFKPLVVKTGRLIYPDEFLTGERVAMVDEKLAVALFNYAEPVERYLLLDGEKYRIVGIIDDQKRVGDHQDYTFYVPYRALEKTALAMSALCIETIPVPNAGGWSAFETATASLSTQGTCISLTKESMNASLPLRAFLCLLGFMAVVFCLRVLTIQSVQLYRAYRMRLRGEYAMHLLPWVAPRGLLLAAGYAACAVVFAWLFMVFVEPVYTFPEWIPAVLVEPDDIATAFWNVWQKQANLFELRSPELIRIRFFRSVMGWACGALALSGGMLAARMGDAMRRLTAKPEKEPDAAEAKPKFNLE